MKIVEELLAQISGDEGMSAEWIKPLAQISLDLKMRAGDGGGSEAKRLKGIADEIDNKLSKYLQEADPDASDSKLSGPGQQIDFSGVLSDFDKDLRIETEKVLAEMRDFSSEQNIREIQRKLGKQYNPRGTSLKLMKESSGWVEEYNRLFASDMVANYVKDFGTEGDLRGELEQRFIKQFEQIGGINPAEAQGYSADMVQRFMNGDITFYDIADGKGNEVFINGFFFARVHVEDGRLCSYADLCYGRKVEEKDVPRFIVHQKPLPKYNAGYYGSALMQAIHTPDKEGMLEMDIYNTEGDAPKLPISLIQLTNREIHDPAGHQAPYALYKDEYTESLEVREGPAPYLWKEISKKLEKSYPIMTLFRAAMTREGMIYSGVAEQKELEEYYASFGAVVHVLLKNRGPEEQTRIIKRILTESKGVEDFVKIANEEYAARKEVKTRKILGILAKNDVDGILFSDDQRTIETLLIGYSENTDNRNIIEGITRILELCKKRTVGILFVWNAYEALGTKTKMDADSFTSLGKSLRSMGYTERTAKSSVGQVLNGALVYAKKGEKFKAVACYNAVLRIDSQNEGAAKGLKDVDNIQGTSAVSGKPVKHVPAVPVTHSETKEKEGSVPAATGRKIDVPGQRRFTV